jgi:hypothetical protein
MTIVGTHRGAVSGKTHVHLLRESAAERAAKAAARRQADAAAGTRPETSAADRSTAGESGSNDSTGPQHWFG